MSTIGMLYPGHSAEDDYSWLERHLRDAADVADADSSSTMEAVRLPVVHTSVGEDAHRVDALLDLGSPSRLADGARELLADHDANAVMWACTSGSFVFGWEGAHEQARRLQDVTGLSTSSTSLAFVHACHALGLERVTVAASYPQDVAEHFVRFLAAGGIEVTAMGSHGIVTAVEVGALGPDEVASIVTGADVSHGAQAILVPDTAMHTLAQLDQLELAAGLPVLTANQVTIWEGLRLLGPVPPVSGVGALFGTRMGG